MNRKTLEVYTDGGSRGNPGESGIGVVIYEQEPQILLWQRGQYVGIHTNNEAEYLALKFALDWLNDYLKNEDNQVKYSDILFKLDSKLVVEQMLGRWKVKDERMKVLKTECVQISTMLPVRVDFKHIPREENTVADKLVNEALDFYLGK